MQVEIDLHTEHRSTSNILWCYIFTDYNLDYHPFLMISLFSILFSFDIYFNTQLIIILFISIGGPTSYYVCQLNCFCHLGLCIRIELLEKCLVQVYKTEGLTICIFAQVKKGSTSLASLKLHNYLYYFTSQDII